MSSGLEAVSTHAQRSADGYGMGLRADHKPGEPLWGDALPGVYRRAGLLGIDPDLGGPEAEIAASASSQAVDSQPEGAHQPAAEVSAASPIPEEVRDLGNTAVTPELVVQ